MLKLHVFALHKIWLIIVYGRYREPDFKTLYYDIIGMRGRNDI